MYYNIILYAALEARVYRGSHIGDESDFLVSSAAKLAGREIKNDFLI
jgi:hypothetical protein